MKLAISFILAACMGVASAVTNVSQQSNKYEVAGIDNPKAVEEFLRSLQEAVAKDDHPKVASMVNYPVTVKISGRRVRLRNKSELLRRYGKVINREVREAIAAQKPNDLFANYQGVMIGGGQIWFSQLYKRKVIKIIAINN